MALKWLKNILQKSEPQASAETIKLSQLEGWLDGRSRDPRFEKVLSGLYSSFAALSRELEKDVGAMMAAAPPQEATPRLLKAGQAARDAVRNQMTVMSEKLSPPPEMDFASAMEYHSVLVNHLGRTVLKFGRSQRYAAAVFPKELERINSDLTRVSQVLAELGSSLEKRQKEMEGVTRSRELLFMLKDDYARQAPLKERVEGAKRELSALEAAEARQRSELEALEASEEGRRRARLRECLEAGAGELQQMEMEMAALVAPLSKALSRLGKADPGDRQSAQSRGVLDLLSSSPVRALDQDIAGPLKELAARVPQLGLKDRKREKVEAHIAHLLEAEPLQALKSRHTRVREEMESLEGQIRQSGQEAKRLQEEMDLLRRRREQIQAELDQSRSALSVVQERVAGEERDLAARVEEMGGGTLLMDL
ncbi:MAG: hypothetical protein GKC10_03280 [Methanosarcinales archaeon]|nr:hypothetical protein [Methanosarcinales archaeon]